MLRHRRVTFLMQHNDLAAHEAREIDEVLQRLRVRFPDADETRVRAAVSDAHRQFGGRPIRDFVPCSWERAARAILAAPPT